MAKVTLATSPSRTRASFPKELCAWPTSRLLEKPARHAPVAARQRLAAARAGRLPKASLVLGLAVFAGVLMLAQCLPTVSSALMATLDVLVPCSPTPRMRKRS